ncbi:MAG: SAM-dependent methyltransferase [Clostridiales bacterium]|nr:SAM-dependent methyltransferase [Clostridiales bacterium]
MTHRPKLRPPQLDARLQALANRVPRCALAADIGADHGRLACWLLGQGVCDRMIVSDISADSLNKAQRLIRRHGLQDRADFVVADGLAALNAAVDVVVIAGLGGATIAEMLADHVRAGQARLVISAQTETVKVRRALAGHGYTLEREDVVLASGRYYTVITAHRAHADYTSRQLAIGPTLRSTDSARVEDYLLWRKGVLSARRDRQSEQELIWLSEEIERAKSNQPTDL